MKTFYKLFSVLTIFVFFNTSAFAAKTLDVIHYKQCGQTWSNMQIGTCGPNSMCNDGCTTCCVAMLSYANGTGATPGSIATFFNTHNLWSGDCVMNWNAILSYPGNTMQWSGEPGFSTAVVKQQIDANNPVIVFVLLPGNQTHFIVVYGYVNNGTSISDFRVLDPLQDNPTNLNTYNIQSLRLYNNVIHNLTVTCSFKINGSEMQAPPNEYEVWKYPGIPSNYNTLTVTVTGRNGNSWDLRLYRPDGTYINAAQNINVDVQSQPFNVDSLDPWFPNSTNYVLKVYERTTPPTLWGTSPTFDISAIPHVSIDPIPNIVHVGQPVTITWHIFPGNPMLPPCYGWRNTAQVQLYRDTTALNVLGSPLVNSGSFTFTVPNITGPNMRVSVSNPPNSSIPPGYVFTYSNSFTIANPTRIVPITEIIPSVYRLYINYPNPFNPATTIKFDIPKTGFTKITIFDVLGNEIVRLVDEELNAGEYRVNFDASSLSSGVYFYKIESNGFTESKKMLLIK